MIVRPISNYPVPETRHRKHAPFKVSFARTLNELDAELRHLGAKNVVLEMDLREQDIRLDGWPRANVSPRTPRVVLSLDSKHGPLRYPCDTYRSAEDNVRAIRLALEALRAVDRYGVTRRGEQYTGWRALPGAGATGAKPMTAADAAAYIDPLSSFDAATILGDREKARCALREALFKVHPDHGGSSEAFHTYQAAKAALVAHFGGLL